MTPNQNAMRAEKQAIWPGGPRIREVAQSAAPNFTPASAHSQGAGYAEILRAASGHLQSGWRWLERKRSQQLSARRLRLTETISLGEKRSVSIVQVDGAQYLIGCSASSVQLLAVLNKENDKQDDKQEGENARHSEKARAL